MIPAWAPLIAMIAGGAMQYKAQSDAAKRQEQETLRSMQRQQEYQRQAEAKALGQAQEFNTDDRAKAQEAIETELTQEFIKPVESAQQINAAQSTTQGAVSNDYTTAKARSNVEQMKAAESLARILGKTTAAGRLRNNEAIRMADTASGIDRLGNFSHGQQLVDKMAIANAGRPNAGMMYGGQALSAIGSIGVAGGFDGLFSGAAETTKAMPNMPLGSGMAEASTFNTGIGAAPIAPRATTLGTGFWGMPSEGATKAFNVPSILRGM